MVITVSYTSSDGVAIEITSLRPVLAVKNSQISHKKGLVMQPFEKTNAERG